MFVLRKPHRIALLLPEITIDGTDAAYAHDAALLVWVTCIELAQRHPSLAVYDPESTPLIPINGRFTPHNASIGSAPTDAFFGPTRRDEVVWLSIALGGTTSSAVRCQAVARDGLRASFEGQGERLSDQIDSAIAAWLSARGLRRPLRRCDPFQADELLGLVRMLTPVLGEHARIWTPDPLPGPGTSATAKLARALANRLPRILKIPTLRLLQLALSEDFNDAILAIDPDHPQALFASYLERASEPPDYAMLRRVIASAPFWARPYVELGGHHGEDSTAEWPSRAPTALESVACAGVAALCRPAQLEIVRQCAARLREARLVDEAIRLLERALASLPEDPVAHLALLDMYAQTDRPGARLAQAEHSARALGCPLDPELPWYADQIEIELGLADALLAVGRTEEANQRRAKLTTASSARRNPQLVTWGHARDAHHRGDPARTVEGFTIAAPTTDSDLAMFIDALVAVGREHDVPLTWGQFGLGGQLEGPQARLAAARGLLAAQDWRRGLEELWRVELTEPARDDHTAIARCGLLLSAAPIELAEAAIADRLAGGAVTLAGRMARFIADFMPDAASRAIVARALGKPTPVDFDSAWLAGFDPSTRSRRAIDAMFSELLTPRRYRSDRRGGGEPDVVVRADRLVNRWLEMVFTEASEDDPPGLAQAAAYVAGHALGRYLAATTQPASPLAGGLRTVASEALALVRRHRAALRDRDALALLGVLDPVLRRVDRWLGNTWLATVERACGIDERAAGDHAGFARTHATVAARMLGPEQTAVLAASIAQLHRDRPEGWASAVTAQAVRLATHTGYLGSEEWADAVVAQLATREIEVDDAIDALHTACYLGQGITAGPCVHAARVLLGVGRAPAAVAVLGTGLVAGPADWRERQLGSLPTANLDLPLTATPAIANARDALNQGDMARAERFGRWAVALDPSNAEARRHFGEALARQGKLPEALGQFIRVSRDRGSELLQRVLSQHPPKTKPPLSDRARAFRLLEDGDHEAAAAGLRDPSWEVRRAALAALRFRGAAADSAAVAQRARSAALGTLASSTGLFDLDAMICRMIAMEIREQAYFPRDPIPRLGERPSSTPDESIARPQDRVVIGGGKLERISDYVALLRELSERNPAEVLTLFDLDHASYVEVARMWALAIDADPSLAAAITAGLSNR